MENRPLALKLNAIIALSEAELFVLEEFHKRRRSFPSGRDLVLQGQSNREAYILMSGWAFSYKIQKNGQRLIIDIRLPGDFIGLQNILLGLADHSIEPLTDIEVTGIPDSELMRAFERAPRLAKGSFWAATRDEAIIMEHLVNIGRRSAPKRVAHLLLELWARLELIGMARQEGFSCPLTQYHLADILGLSPVHVNRVMRSLREEGMVTFHNGFVSFDDFDQLTEFAEFDPAYLNQAGPQLA